MKLDPPKGYELPPRGFDVKDRGYNAPKEDGSNVEVSVNPSSKRLQVLTPFVPINQVDMTDMRVLLKAQGKCTTDHISMAGPWLKFRGHLENISNNCFIGAINEFNGRANHVANYVDSSESAEFLHVPRFWQKI